jgi:hypothetical protein
MQRKKNNSKISLILSAAFAAGGGHRRGVQFKGGGGGEGRLTRLRGHGHGLAQGQRLAGGHHGGHVGYAEVATRSRHSEKREVCILKVLWSQCPDTEFLDWSDLSGAKTGSNLFNFKYLNKFMQFILKCRLTYS